ncbi:RNI-like protein [Gigaspora margarita]|uniref:RNI-like protein n=1 Tax=Gigaspora margarita TaxID=4874 RepID=A0A8H4A3X7_GIGMA|nr:RNI-like protein [Gigaspora margarita]
MIGLPNECLIEIFNNFKCCYGYLFSCLLVNRQWCRNVIPILCDDLLLYCIDKRVIRICLLLMNEEEKAALFPFNILPPSNDLKPLFEYTSYTKSITWYNLKRGIENWIYSAEHRSTYKCLSRYKRTDEAVLITMYSLITMLFRTSDKIKHLHIAAIKELSDIYCIYYKQFLRSLIDVFCKNTCLTSLTLYNCKFNAEEIKMLSEVLCKNTTLSSLVINDKEFGDEEIKAFINVLYKNTTLNFLNLNHSQLGYIGIKTLTEALCENISITSLHLDGNILCIKGCKALAKALCRNTTLTFLSLYNCYIDVEGIKVIIEALYKNTTLTSLNVKCNSFGRDGIKMIEEAQPKLFLRISYKLF